MGIPKWLQRLNSWSAKYIPQSEESAGERIFNSTINQANEAETQEERDDIYKNRGAATLVTTAASLSPYIFTNPAAMRVLDVVGTADGIRNLTTDNGIAKTVRLTKEGNYGKAALSGFGDAMDLIGAGDAVRMAAKIGNKAYRGYHAYNTIFPYGYDDPIGRGKEFVKSMFLEKKYNKPVWNGTRKEDETIKSVLKSRPDKQKIMKLAREDAFAIYTGQTPKNGIYVKNADGTYSYNIDKFLGMKINDPHVFIDNKRDYLAYAHGGLHDVAHFPGYQINTGTDLYKYGDIYMKDVWDLNPFERSGDRVISDRINQRLKRHIGTDTWRDRIQKLRTYMYDKGYWSNMDGKPKTVFGKTTKWLDRPLNIYRTGMKNVSTIINGEPYVDFIEIPRYADNIIDKLTKNSITKAIDSKIANFEVGPLIGGKPWTMETTFPYTTVVGPSHPWGQTKVGTITPEGFNNIRK